MLAFHMPFEIRPAEYSDLKDVAHVHVTSWQQAYINQIPQSYLDSLDVLDRQKRWEDIFNGKAAEDKNIEVAICNGALVGFVSYGMGRDEGRTQEGEIYAVYLLQEFWGHSIGHALFQRALSKLESNGVKKLYLWVLDTNKNAIASYQKWGGHIAQDPPKSAEIGGRLVQEIIIEFNLD